MLIEMTQHPVGQGGLFYGVLYYGDKRDFRWVYDCGSNDRKELGRQIGKLPKEKIDALFLSHMHRDHVNGFDELLKRVKKIDQVILPYLDEYDQLAVLADYASHGPLTTDIIEMVTNPGEWLTRRGVERVILVLHEDRDRDVYVDGRDIDPTDPDRRAAEFSWQWSLSLRRTARARSTDKVCVAHSEAISALYLPKIDIRWMLVTHVEPADKNKKSNFEKKVNHIMWKRGVTNLLDLLNTRHIEHIRKCYDEIWKDHNLISMSLYAGPEMYEYGRNRMRIFGNIKHRNKIFIRRNRYAQSGYPSLSFWHFFGPYNIASSSSCGGWMLTGDQNFSVARRRINFQKKYRKFLKFVNVLMMPHHGSRHNISPEFLRPFKNLDVCYVAAGSGNNYGHPHFETELMVRLECGSSTFFHAVGKEPTSMLEMRCCVW